MSLTSHLVLALGMAGIVPAQAQAEVIFSCAIGTRRATVTLEEDRLTYRFGRPRRPEIVIAGDRGQRQSHLSSRTLFAR